MVNIDELKVGDYITPINNNWEDEGCLVGRKYKILSIEKAYIKFERDSGLDYSCAYTLDSTYSLDFIEKVNKHNNIKILW